MGPLKRDDARLTHRIKTLYGFHAITALLEDPGRAGEAEEKLRYLMS